MTSFNLITSLKTLFLDKEDIYIHTHTHTLIYTVEYYLAIKKNKTMPFAATCNGNPLQYSCLENPIDWGAWWAAVHGVSESRTRLSDFTFTFHFHGLEKEMATHSSVLAWRIPGTGEPGGLPSMGLHRVGHDWSDLAAAVKKRGRMKKGYKF